jgi:hypothetical protein
MTDPEGMQALYADTFEHSSKGHGLFHPCSTEILKLGAIGFFDDVGKWTRIDIPSFAALIHSDKMSIPERGITWGPLCSKDVHRSTAGESANMYVF